MIGRPSGGPHLTHLAAHSKASIATVNSFGAERSPNGHLHTACFTTQNPAAGGHEHSPSLIDKLCSCRAS